jgi:competence protein ComEA
MFLSGYGYKIYRQSLEQKSFNFSYRTEDSLFISANKLDNDKEQSNDTNKEEILRLSSTNIFKAKSTAQLLEKSININTANKSDFQKLPGIGEKTAESIISYRNKIGKFSSVNGLLNIQGIGEAKFSKIKKYLCIK